MAFVNGGVHMTVQVATLYEDLRLVAHTLFVCTASME